MPAERGVLRSPLRRGRTCTREGRRHRLTGARQSPRACALLCASASRGRVSRDLEMKRRAAPDRADGPDAPPVSLDDALADREAEAGAGTRTAIGLPESIEDMREIVCGDAMARVRDRNLHRVVGIRCPHHDLPASI